MSWHALPVFQGALSTTKYYQPAGAKYQIDRSTCGSRKPNHLYKSLLNMKQQKKQKMHQTPNSRSALTRKQQPQTTDITTVRSTHTHKPTNYQILVKLAKFTISQDPSQYFCEKENSTFNTGHLDLWAHTKTNICNNSKTAVDLCAATTTNTSSLYVCIHVCARKRKTLPLWCWGRSAAAFKGDKHSQFPPCARQGDERRRGWENGGQKGEGKARLLWGTRGAVIEAAGAPAGGGREDRQGRRWRWGGFFGAGRAGRTGRAGPAVRLTGAVGDTDGPGPRRCGGQCKRLAYVCVVPSATFSYYP